MADPHIARRDTNGAGQAGWQDDAPRPAWIATLCWTAGLLIAAVGLIVFGLE